MPIVPLAHAPVPAPLPTALAPLPRLLAYTQALGLERHLRRPKRGLPTLVLALVWLVLAWRGSGRPHHLADLDEPLLAALLGGHQPPCPKTLHRSLGYFAAHDVRAAVEAAYLAELPHRPGRVWAAIDAHQLPYWGRGKLDRFQKGWAGGRAALCAATGSTSRWTPTPARSSPTRWRAVGGATTSCWRCSPAGRAPSSAAG